MELNTAAELNRFSQSPITIVRGEPSRAGEILLLLQDAARWMESKGIKQWTPGQFNEADIVGYFEDREVYLALEKDEIIGLFTLQFTDPQYWGPRNDDSYAYLHRLTVARSYRGSGLGSKMLYFAADLAIERGLKGLRFDTVAHNVKLNRYYQSLGFHFMGSNDMGGGRLVNLYEKFKDTGDADEIILQYFGEADFEYLKSWADSPEFLKQWAGPSLSFPIEDQELIKYITNANHSVDSNLLIYSAVHKASGQVIGHISLAAIDRDNRSARVGRVVIDPEYRGRGIGLRMMQEMLRIAFQALELHRVSLGVFDFNTSALKSYEAAGFRREGLQREAARFTGGYVDCIELSMLDREWAQIYKS
ncbi:GNAT family N-acetyltransferase [Paenibacillus wynnii]|uniref:GNAT family N-acetyltransferase n=1 Tax=Paenibacillus wynnii TaxID=268407 RepID=UPI00068ACBBA|nr:GNAT family N-acetyltransferase [Paenibacillus wynnii]